MESRHYLGQEEIGEILAAAESQLSVKNLPAPDIYIGEIPGWSPTTIERWLIQAKA